MSQSIWSVTSVVDFDFNTCQVNDFCGRSCLNIDSVISLFSAQR